MLARRVLVAGRGVAGGLHQAPLGSPSFRVPAAWAVVAAVRRPGSVAWCPQRRAASTAGAGRVHEPQEVAAAVADGQVEEGQDTGPDPEPEEVEVEEEEEEDGVPGFDGLGLCDDVCAALVRAGVDKPTEVQREAIPVVLSGRNVAISSQTGTGKTLGYALPLVHRLHTTPRAPRPEQPVQLPVVVVVVPSVELANQTAAHIQRLTRHAPLSHVKCSVVVGGPSIHSQAQSLARRPPHILVATPGRLLSLLSPQATPSSSAPSTRPLPPLSLSGVRVCVIDECERMLDLGFMGDLVSIWQKLPRPNVSPLQMVFVSATLVPHIQEFMTRLAPTRETVNLNPDLDVAPSVKHIAFNVPSRRKGALLLYLLRRKTPLRDKNVLVFVRTRKACDALALTLTRSRFAAAAVHKELSVSKRAQVMKDFADGAVRILISTDVLSRGIDLPSLDVVINFHLPHTPPAYVHRVGRVGRAGRTGMAISFVDPDAVVSTVAGQAAELSETGFMQTIEDALGKPIEKRKVPGPWQTAASSDHYHHHHHHHEGEEDVGVGAIAEAQQASTPQGEGRARPGQGEHARTRKRSPSVVRHPTTKAPEEKLQRRAAELAHTLGEKEWRKTLEEVRQRTQALAKSQRVQLGTELHAPHERERQHKRSVRKALVAPRTHQPPRPQAPPPPQQRGGGERGGLGQFEEGRFDSVVRRLEEKRARKAATPRHRQLVERVIAGPRVKSKRRIPKAT